jgi:hypothetical protein
VGTVVVSVYHYFDLNRGLYFIVFQDFVDPLKGDTADLTYFLQTRSIGACAIDSKNGFDVYLSDLGVSVYI